MSIPKMHLTTEAKMVRLVRHMAVRKTPLGHKEGVALFGETAIRRALHAGVLRRETGSRSARYVRGYRFERIREGLEEKVKQDKVLREAIRYA